MFIEEGYVVAFKHGVYQFRRYIQTFYEGQAQEKEVINTILWKMFALLGMQTLFTRIIYFS